MKHNKRIILSFILLLVTTQIHAAIVVDETALVSGSYTITQDGQVTITITGADGGAGSNTLGGSGAEVAGVFDVTAGQVVRYVVGEAGNTHANSSAGGGGSTGVYIDTTLVMVAGAGGGGDNSNGAVGLGGNTGTDGDSGTGAQAGAGGTGGNGGGANPGDSAGGGGINSPGGSAAAGGGGQAVAAPALPALLAIAPGGSGAGTGSTGGDGFSGGGGADSFYSGGAGGYSGGGAAGSNGSAGGGGSYVNTGMAGYVSASFTAGTDGGGGTAGSESDGSIVVDFAVLVTVPGINPLPTGDTNNATPVCGTAGLAGGGNISGVINTYYPATASAAAGATSITIGAARGSSTPAGNLGDLLLVIQIQDALIDSSNTAVYGDGLVATDAAGSLDVGQTGLYEFAVSASAVIPTGGGTLSLLSPLQHSYNYGDNQRFQVIRVPRYTDVTLSADITALPWDGNSGGIVALDILGSLDLAGHSIDVTGVGFRGGIFDGNDADAILYDRVIANTAGTAITDLYAEKGEGIAGTPIFGGLTGSLVGYPGGDLARGAPGNAGGGGQTHNSGGGGGSNIGAGGNGGESWPSGMNGGYGGGSFNGYPGRLLLGGGGGAGNQNNDPAGGGGSGGGLVFINAYSIVPNGNIVADGGDGITSVSNDGAGGAGGGGTIIIRTSSTTLAGLSLSVNGGNGGDVNYTDPHGPGGGGGGGAIYINQTGTGAALSVHGGQPGTHLLGTEGAHGATAGEDGHSLSFASTDVPFMLVCDFGDAPSTYGTAGHILDVAVTSAGLLQIGTVLDYEYENLSSSDALADDQYYSSNPSFGIDEDGVNFRSPAGSGESIFADVDVHNGSTSTATLCAWLDIPSGGAVDGSFDVADGQCLNLNPGDSTYTFQWNGLPTDKLYTTYARFRLSEEQFDEGDATGRLIAGEVEDYQIVFDFTPTAVTIGKVDLEAARVTDFLSGLGVDQMDRATLLALLQAWDPAAAAALADDARREAILTALYNYLDPDGDTQVAVLSWDTLEERGTIGFYVDRRQGEDAWKRINNDMLPGLINAPMGGEYRLADPGVTSGWYQYHLIEQEARGTIRSYGPFNVELP